LIQQKKDKVINNEDILKSRKNKNESPPLKKNNKLEFQSKRESL
jgi:hypothetical protein